MARIAVRRLPIATISQLMGMTIDRHAARRIRGNLKLAGAANPRLGIPTLFVGDKISINKILNKEISVLHYRIEPSKHGTDDYAQMQIELDGEKWYVSLPLW